MDSTHFLYLGTEDWRHPAWRGGFYPEDMPEDWLLPYYNSHFKSVYLTADAVRHVKPEVWSIWLNDTLDDFVFIVECEESLGLPDSLKVRCVQADWIARHVCWLDETTDLRALAQRIASHAASGEELFILSRQGDLARLGQVANLRQVMGY